MLSVLYCTGAFFVPAVAPRNHKDDWHINWGIFRDANPEGHKAVLDHMQKHGTLFGETLELFGFVTEAKPAH